MNRKLKTILIILIIIVLGILLFNPTDNYERLDIAGSTSVQPVVEALSEKFTELHANDTESQIKINVQGGGSGLGIRSVNQGIVDIGTSSKELTKEESKGLTQIILGYEGIVIVVNKENKVSDLSITQLRGIYNGSIRNWKQVGGKDLEIHVVSREDGSGTRDAFESLVLNNTKTYSKAIIQSSTESVKQAVVSDPGAIGYVSLAHMSNNVNPVSVDGIYASDATILDGTYKLQRAFILLIKGTPTGPVKEFLDFINSTEGQKVIEEEKIVLPQQK